VFLDTTAPGTLVIAVLVLTASVPAKGRDRDEVARVEFFEKKVRPILVSHCYTCHAADTKPSGGLRVDDRNGLLTGGNTGPAVLPGDPARSLLLQRPSEAREVRRKRRCMSGRSGVPIGGRSSGWPTSSSRSIRDESAVAEETSAQSEPQRQDLPVGQAVIPCASRRGLAVGSMTGP